MISNEQFNQIIDRLIDGSVEIGGKILGAVIIYIIGKLIVNWLNRLFAKLLKKRKVDESVQSFLKSIVNITLMVMLFLAVVGKLGVELTSFAALLASVGVTVGMALSGQLQNFAGGIIVLVFRPYKVGDYIESAAGASGTVKEIQIFHTVLITPDNKIVYAPNGAMSSAVVTNYSKEDTRRVDFSFNVSYGSDFKQVQEVIMSLIEADKRIFSTPAPFVELGTLAAGGVSITVRVWVKADDYWDVNFDMNKNVYATFNEKGIAFPIPNVKVHQV